MRHLITGGSGFIGNVLARRLRERGDVVCLIDIWSDPAHPTDIEFVHCSILDRDGVAAAMRGIDVVHHCAALVAQTGAGRRHWDVNVEGTRIVAEEAQKAGREGNCASEHDSGLRYPSSGSDRRVYAVATGRGLRSVEARGRTADEGHLRAAPAFLSRPYVRV